MTGVSDPVKYGFVQSLAHPGGSITGVSHQVVQGSGKRVELFKEILPGLKRMLTVRVPGYVPSEKSMAEIREAADRLKIDIVDRTVESRKDIQDVMAGVRPDTVDGIMILPDSHIIANLDLLIEESLARRVPAFGIFDYMAVWGAVAADGPSAREAGALAASYVDKIGKGASPADLAVIPVDPKLVINRTEVFQVSADVRWIHVVRALVNIHEPGFGTHLRNRFRGCNKRVRYGDYDVAELHAGGRQRKPQCVSSVSCAYTVFAPAEFREGLLELLNHRAPDETGSAECGLEHSGKLLL